MDQTDKAEIDQKVEVKMVRKVGAEMDQKQSEAGCFDQIKVEVEVGVEVGVEAEGESIAGIA